MARNRAVAFSGGRQHGATIAKCMMRSQAKQRQIRRASLLASSVPRDKLLGPRARPGGTCPVAWHQERKHVRTESVWIHENLQPHRTTWFDSSLVLRPSCQKRTRTTP
eukprot:3451005-Amphidinium_carterae.1